MSITGFSAPLVIISASLLSCAPFGSMKNQSRDISYVSANPSVSCPLMETKYPPYFGALKGFRMASPPGMSKTTS